MFKHRTKRSKAYSLVEVLIAMIIISTVMIVATSTIFGSSVVSINNEIADRVNTMMVRMLELTKKADGSIPHCDLDEDIVLLPDNFYAVGRIDLTDTNEAKAACIRPVADSQKISTCTDSSYYLTTLILPDDYVEYEQQYCIQMYVEEIEDSVFEKITVTAVFDDITDENIKKVFYGLL